MQYHDLAAEVRQAHVVSISILQREAGSLLIDWLEILLTFAEARLELAQGVRACWCKQEREQAERERTECDVGSHSYSAIFASDGQASCSYHGFPSRRPCRPEPIR